MWKCVRVEMSTWHLSGNRDKVGKAYDFVDNQRVSHLEPAVYVKGSGADSAITLAITSIKNRLHHEGG